jgi:hypothetical protein
MTSPATNKNLSLHATTTPKAPRTEQVGWDPFEVWRTRVLLPRLAERRDEKQALTPTVPVKLVRP